MGTASTKKFIKQVSGTLNEEAALLTTAGAADANKIPALNASGILHPSLLNAQVTSAGSADAGKIVQLDPTGKLDPTVLPSGIGASTISMICMESLAAGDFINIFDDSGGFRCRKADANTSGRWAHGFVLNSVGAGLSATVYLEGLNTSVTGAAPGYVFLSATAGLSAASPPSNAGQVVQRLGVAVTATSILFEPTNPIVLA